MEREVDDGFLQAEAGDELPKPENRSGCFAMRSYSNTNAAA